jgi:hypothetical protein
MPSIEARYLDEVIWTTRLRKLWEARQLGVAPRLLHRRMWEHAETTVPAYAEGGEHGAARGRLITRDEVRGEGARFHSRIFLPDDLVVARTSGTTGVPLSVVRDPASFYGFAYDTFSTVFRSIPELTGPLVRGGCAMAVINDNPHRVAFEQVHPALNFAFVRRLILSHDERVDASVLMKVAEAAPPLLYGRPRSIVRLARVAECSGILGLYSPRAILCSGDNLHSDERAFIERTFRAPVYNAYGSEECGFLAIECSLHDGLHVLAERAVVESLPVGAQEPKASGSGELVITGLENWAMPMIRYRSGDWGVVSTAPCACGHSGTTIKNLSGRDSPYFIVNGTRVNPSIFNVIFESLPVRQFQVCQEEDDFLRVLWVPTQKGGWSSTAAAMEAGIGGLIGDVRLSVCRVDTIGSPDGKVQRYVRSGTWRPDER